MDEVSSPSQDQGAEQGAEGAEQGAEGAEQGAEGAERARLAECDAGTAAWRRWGPYLAERAWGTVREDYSADGDAWDYFPFEDAHRRAYRWNEDGMAGICDDEQLLCLALALWNGAGPDPQGADVRPDRRAGQPRRGRQGVLVVPRRHPDLVVPARGATTTRRQAFPYEDLAAEQPPTEPARARVRAGRHRGLRRRPLLGRDGRRGPRPAPRTCCCASRSPTPAPTRRRIDVLADACGSATPGRGAAEARQPTIGLADGRTRRVTALHRRAAPAGDWELLRVTGRGGPRAAVLRQRDQHRQALAVSRRPGVPEGRHHDHVVHRRRDGQPGRHRHQGGACATT